MRYTGNKTRLLPFIEEVIKKHKITGEVFADLFAGTGAVGDYFKKEYTIISNDFMYYAFVINQAKIKNQTIPSFSRFYRAYGNIETIFDYFNHKTYTTNEHFFLYHHYTPQANRMFFTETNAEKIDGVRLEIDRLYKDQLLSENEYMYLLASLLESVMRVSNTSGTYEAFFKFWEPRAKKDFELLPLNIESVEKTINSNQVFQKNANDLVREIQGDIAYIDTPYTAKQYGSMYHLLETIARYDYPFIKGIGGKRVSHRPLSLYCKKKEAAEQFTDLLTHLQFQHVLISYSTQALLSLNTLIAIAKKVSVNGKVYVESIPYRPYRSYATKKNPNTKPLKEVILYFQK